MPDDSKKTLVLIDSNAIIHRAYHALPKNMSTSKGELTNAVYGFTTTLIRVLEDLHPTHIAASFDVGKATARLAQYAEYKATRVKADQELYDQIPKVKELLEALNIPIYTAEGHEADDVIGTIVERVNGKGNEARFGNVEGSRDRTTKDDTGVVTDKPFTIYIISGDKDIFQLIDGNIFVYWLKRGLSEAGVVNRKVIEVEWGLQPEDFIDLKALAGDSSDNIPGVPGIGPKTATELLKKFDTLGKLYEKIESFLAVISTEVEKSDTQCHPELAEGSLAYGKISPPTSSSRDDKVIEGVAKELKLKPRIVKLLVENKDQAFMSQKLATINRNVPIDFKLEDCEWGDYDKEKLKEFFERMQFHSLLKRFGAETMVGPPKTDKAKLQKKEDEQLSLL